MRLRTTTALAALLAAGVTPLTLTSPASAAAAKYADDFNGDGYRDLAIGDEGATVGGKKQAGAVIVIWGSSKGLDPARRTVVSQNSAGIPGAAETSDFFGRDITTVDLNKDGYADVIATAPGEEDGAYNGVFTVLWGSKSGLTSGSAYRNPKHKDRGFAKDIAVGDFDADGRQDVVAVDDQNIWYLRGPFTKSGSRGKATDFDPIDGENIDPELVVSGKVTKDGTADFAVLGRDWDTDDDRVWFYKGGKGGPKKTKKVNLPSSASLLEGSATIADFDKNGYGDLAIGGRRSGKGGGVYVLRGTSTGPSTSAKTITQSTSGVPGTPESWDDFGSDVSSADTNGDGYPDLAVGVPGEVLGDNWAAVGGVTVLRGSSSGLTGKNARNYDYATAGVAGVPNEDNDAWFGDSVLLRDFNRDGRAELVAAAPESIPGRLHLLPGTSSGPTGKGSQMLTLKTLGLTSLSNLYAELAD
ncbi:FG-GAP-like repeat-containing protein [Streptomyces poonensis]|uniref:Integrin-like protein n=1 Tax=Streptomyces poonensis TaxID=68255 RepID=A0A918PJF1_9ACTN|nr:FG-GAP-like repeat-containing protein [Streptomyces poonensis]GGZ13008.1 hypothetical protein GCM10010365_35980 [Streptomyces poonensis]GLJ91947.1 hypothetical protein GCM10017589_45550 [Streptomyces poonensis]